VKVKARVLLAAAVLCSAALVAPPVAAQVPTGRGDPPCPEVEPTPTPSPSPEASESPTPEASPTPSPSPTPDDCFEPQPDPEPEPNPGDKDDNGNKGDGKKDDKKDKNQDAKDKKKNHKHKKDNGSGGGNDKPGFLEVADSYDTSILMAVAAHLRSLGWSSDEILSTVFTPFIVGGRANWIDTWGAPRFGPGLLVRTHEGQDVFCEYGDPVLAVEKGVIEYDEGGLGGTIARLHRPDGSYWYYAHLSAVNDKKIPSGSRVKPGDVIGFCGNTGNAITTPPHVHFGWYTASGVAKDPMRKLIRWLRAAERHAALVLARVQGDRLAQIETFRAARLFGDSFAPDLSPVDPTAGSVFAEAEAASQSMLGLAQAAFMAAFEGVPDEGSAGATSSKPGSDGTVKSLRPSGSR
jgi:murein DD-endopeptidase MepM/ murein hydrolase activator NlpD